MTKKRTSKPADSELQTRFGRAVWLRRQELGLTQETLAFQAGIHRTYVADVERGARNVTLRSAAKIARALDVSVASLLT